MNETVNDSDIINGQIRVKNAYYFLLDFCLLTVNRRLRYIEIEVLDIIIL